MSNREYAAGVLALLNDHTIATQALAVSALLDEVTHRPEPQWSSLQNADSGNTFGGYGGGGGAVGPEVLTWQHRARGYCARPDDQRFTTEVGLHTQLGFDLAPVADASGLELGPNPDAYCYRVDAEIGFPSFRTANDDVRMLAVWLKYSGMGEPLGASNTIAGRLTWVRRHWRLKQGAASLWETLTGGKPPENNDLIETDLLTWFFDTGDATTQFVVRPVRPSTADASDFKKTIDAAQKLAELVRVTLCHAPVTGEALRRRLLLDRSS
jgi:hypothetical protein